MTPRPAARPALGELNGRSFDVAVIGGGANGASAAQQLAAAGYAVLLVDKDDFASGASGHSSRFLHCGLRYLATGSSLLKILAHPLRFLVACRMAREAMACRAEMAATIPERLQAVRFCFPLFADGPYKPWQLRLAFNLLERLGPGTAPLDFRLLAPEEALRELPALRALRDLKALRAVALYREYQYDWAERIVLDAVFDARRLGATIRNHTPLVGLAREGDRWRLTLGDAFEPNARATVSARIVLNMAGIWIDRVNALAAPGAKRLVTGTKGAHVVVKLPEEWRGLGVATFGRDLWPFYCLPWKDLHYFGPTETLYEGDPDDIRTEEEDLAWILEEAKRMLPGLAIGRENVISSWACVRPLTYDPVLLPRGRRSREVHDLAECGLPDVFALTAGPIMTHRTAGTELLRRIAPRLRPSGSAQPLSRGALPIPDDVAAARAEQAMTLADVLFRRTGAAYRADLALGEAERAARAVAPVLGWDEARVERELADYRRLLERRFTLTRDPRAVPPVSARSSSFA